jgi:drug/metabolite transporter (DMT)-like permease
MQSFVLPAMAGACFSIIGITYRMGQSRGIAPLHLLGIASIAGAAVFLGLFRQTHVQIQDVPSSMWFWGVVGGLGQYTAVRMFGLALRLGSLSPVWCALSLPFIPTLAYSWFFLSETLLPMQYLAIVAGVLCVLIASVRPAGSNDRSEVGAGQPGGRWLDNLVYLGVLATVFVSNSLMTIGQRDLGTLRDSSDQADIVGYGHFLLMLVYLVLVVCVAADTVVIRQTPKATWKTLIGLGLLVAVGSIGGTGLLNACSSSTIVFAVSGITTIIIVAVVSAAVFDERVTASWYATVALGVLTVTLANWGSIAVMCQVSR